MLRSITSATLTTAYRATQNPSATTNPRHGPDEKVDTAQSKVRISAEGKAASTVEPGSLESYRIPDWMPELLPRQTIAVGSEAIEETREQMEMLEDLKADGHLSASDRQFMQAYRENNSPATQQYHANAAFARKFRDELIEYSEIRNSAFQQARLENGIETREDYVDKVLHAPDDNTALRNRVVEKLLDNPRALELMDKLGIDRPSR